MTATEASRGFSAVLNRVAAGEDIEIVRNGAVVALLSPPRRRLVTGDRYRELMASAPPIDTDFVTDVRRAREDAGRPEGSWPS